VCEQAKPRQLRGGGGGSPEAARFREGKLVFCNGRMILPLQLGESSKGKRKGKKAGGSSTQKKERNNIKRGEER